MADVGKEPVLFTGLMRGEITEEVRRPEADVMPYDRIFIPEGQTKTISELTLAEKNSFSQRGAAFLAVGEFLGDK